MNYFKYSEGLLYTTYLYIDTKEHLSNQIFIDNNLIVIANSILASEKNQYHVLFVKTRRNKEGIFVKCMEELYNEILLNGHLDYTEVCNSLIGKINSSLEQQKVAKKV